MSDVNQHGADMATDNDSQNAIWFFFTMLYLIVDYGRPQEIVPFGFIRPALILILVLVFFLVTNGNQQFFKYRQVRMMCLFILLLGCYVPFVRNQYYSFVAFKTQVLYMPFILSLIVCVDSMKRLRTLMIVCVSIQIYIALYAITHGGVGPGNYFNDENDLCLYMNMWIPVCYYLFVSDKNRFNRMLYIVGGIFGVLSVVVSSSRGGFVGLLAVIGTMWMLSKKKIALFLLISVMGMAVFLWAGQVYLDEMATITDVSERTADTRLQSWASGWRMFLDNPLGVGGHNFPIRFPEYQGDAFRKSMWGRAAHSLWFTLIPETGVIGIYLYLMLLYTNFKDILLLKRVTTTTTDDDMKFLHSLGMAFIASLVGFLASATFISVLYYAHYWYLTGFIVVAVRNLDTLAYGRGVGGKPHHVEM